MQYDDDDTTATAPLIRKRNLKQIRYHVHIVIGGKQLKSYDEYTCSRSICSKVWSKVIEICKLLMNFFSNYQAHFKRIKCFKTLPLV